jgi:hypothetical protein
MSETTGPSAVPIRRSRSSLRTVPRTVRDRLSLPYSRNRKGEHPTRHLTDFAGVLKADAYSGFNPLLDPERAPGPITPALCWAHSRREFFKLADLKKQASGATTTDDSLSKARNALI